MSLKTKERMKRDDEIRDYIANNLTISVKRDNFLDGKCIKVTLNLEGEPISEDTHIL